MDAHVLTVDDIAFDKIINNARYQNTWWTTPIGYKVENASTNPTVKRIDRNGEEFDPAPEFFWNHELFIMPKVLLSPSGVVTPGPDRKGTGLDITGASGDVMVWCNNAQYKSWYESDSDTLFKLFAPYYSNYRGFDYHPHCYAGGGIKHDHFFLAAYEAGLKDDNGTLKFNSCSGVQPWTGGQMRSVPFTAGNTAFVVGETITGGTSGAVGTVVSFHVTSGDWGAGTAVGVVYIRNYGVEASTATAFVNGETLTRTSGSAITSGVSTVINLTIDNALTYASNKGVGWTIENVYCRTLLQDLFYTQHGTRDSQTAPGLGLGLVNLASGVGFAGKLTGADGIDTNLDEFGTGVGTGTNGLTPNSWNGLQNWLGGNVFEFTTGINFFASDSSYRVTKGDGTGIIAGALPAGSYENGIGTVPLVDGYYSKIMTDPLGSLLNIPSVAGDANSASNKAYCDYWYKPTANPSVLLSGGHWINGLNAGVGFRTAYNAPSYSHRNIGARLQYIPP
ncbi:MAG TPA: hypothetical protein VGK38_08605 [Prolixibacteraceae bacterium]|jgi:hypothetical protein